MPVEGPIGENPNISFHLFTDVTPTQSAGITTDEEAAPAKTSPLAGLSKAVDTLTASTDRALAANIDTEEEKGMLKVAETIVKPLTTPENEATLKQKTERSLTIETVVDTTAQGTQSVESALTGKISMAETVGLSGVGVGLEAGEIGVIINAFKTVKTQIDNQQLLLTQKENQLNTLNTATPKDTEAIKNLEREIYLLKDDIKVNTNTLYQLGAKLSNNVFNVASAGAGEVANVLTARAHVVSTLLQSSSFIGASGTNAVSMVNSLIAIVQDAQIYIANNNQLAEKTQQLAQLKQKQNPTPEDQQTIKTLSREVRELERKGQELRAKFVENATRSASGFVGSASNVLQTITQAAPHLGHVAATVLSVGSGVGGAVTAGAGIVINVKNIYDNAMKHTKILDEITRFEEMRSEAKNPTVKAVLEMKIRNLNQQKEENLVSLLQNIPTLAASAVATAGAIALIVGASAVVSATGIGAVVLAGVAISIGAGYLIYKNHPRISATAMQGMSKLTEIKLAGEIKYSTWDAGHIKEETKATKLKIQQSWNERLDVIREDLDGKIRDLMDVRSDYAEEAENTMLNEEGRKQVQADIKKIDQEILALRKEKQEMMEALSQQHRVVIDSSMSKLHNQEQKIANLQIRLQEASAKTAEWKAILEDYSLCASLKNTSREEARALKEQLTEGLKDPQTVEELKDLLDDAKVFFKGTPVLKDMVSYLTKPV
jgi:hypothetical protein